MYLYKKIDDFKNLLKEFYKLRVRINSVCKEYYSIISLVIVYILGNILKLLNIELFFFKMCYMYNKGI